MTLEQAGAVRIDGAAMTLVLDGAPIPAVAYLGPRLPAGEDLAALVASRAQPRHGSQPDEPVGASLFPHGITDGLHGAALEVRRGGVPLRPRLVRQGLDARADSVAIELLDADNAVAVTVSLAIVSGATLVASARITNHGAALEVTGLHALSLAVPFVLDHMTRFSGRWAGEMQAHAGPIPPGDSAFRSLEGRPGFGGSHWLLLHEEHVSADHGLALGVHFASSGDGGWRVARDADGVQLSVGPRLDASEIMLAPGESYVTPHAVLHLSVAGRNGLRREAHAYVRHAVLPSRRAWGPRRVHLNSWEALGFALDAAGAMGLADAAAEIGAERFVLDDGWFLGRVDDRRALGDWTADPARFPNGLEPVIDHVRARGMDFGLWVEPEMVSPDSKLYRDHPDWCLHLEGAPRPTQRHQLLLDLTRADVVEHLFRMLDGLLRQHAIAYLKWDHNRPLFPRAGKGQAQAEAFHALLDRLREAHPAVEIETCASGGGRIDHAVLRRAHRVWPSDNNDPHDRVRIDTAWSLFLPPEIRGAHVGPSPNPITGRRVPMDLRAKLALFGHMGIEADPRAMTQGERGTLAAIVALYKAWRPVLHAGVEREIERGDGGFGRLVLAEDLSRGLAVVGQLVSPADYNATPVRLTGLPPERRYRVALPEPWGRGRAMLPDPDGWRRGRVLSGRALADGIVLPLQAPESAWLIALEAVD